MEAAPVTARQTLVKPRVASLTITRVQSDTPMNPALDVSWTKPDDIGLTISWYKLRYRKQGATEWTEDSTVIETTSHRLTDLEAGATYQVQVATGTNEQGLGDWSDTGSGRANRAPNATTTFFNGGTFPAGTVATYAESGQGALGPFFADADGDALTYTASSQHPALLGVSLSGTAGSATLTATLLNQGASTITFTATDAFGGQVTRTATITVTAKTSRSIAENSAAGTAVGAPVTGTPYDDGDDQTDDALTYTLAGKAAESGKFVIDSASGQISLAQGATLDYETDDAHRETETFEGQLIAKFYRGEVHYTVDGHAAVINVSILVTDVAPVVASAPTLTRTEFSGPTDPALDVTWAAAAANGTTITGYEARHRKKVAEGEEANQWTDYSGTLGATATTFNHRKPRGRRRLRGAGAGGEQRRGHGSLVGHRGRPGQPAADHHGGLATSTVDLPATRSRWLLVTTTTHRGALLRRRRRHTHVFGDPGASGPGRRMDRGRSGHPGGGGAS